MRLFQTSPPTDTTTDNIEASRRMQEVERKQREIRRTLQRYGIEVETRSGRLRHVSQRQSGHG